MTTFMTGIKDKFMGIKLTKSWQYLAYILLLLPAVLFLIGWLTQSKVLGTIFHNYGLFVASPIPNLSAYTGIIGLGIAVWFTTTAIRRRDWIDLAVSLVLIALNAAYFLLEWNYLLLKMLTI